MGCPCRQIRAALSHLPGGKFLVGLLPALPPKGPQMKMLARVAGQSFNLAHGPHYRADDDRVVHVDASDVAEMHRLGCTLPPPEGIDLTANVTAVDPFSGEPVPEKAEAPVAPVVQDIMRAEPASEAENPEQ
jgi:hypothetical protein